MSGCGYRDIRGTIQGSIVGVTSVLKVKQPCPPPELIDENNLILLELPSSRCHRREAHRVSEPIINPTYSNEGWLHGVQEIGLGTIEVLLVATNIHLPVTNSR